MMGEGVAGVSGQRVSIFNLVPLEKKPRLDAFCRDMSEIRE